MEVQMFIYNCTCYQFHKHTVLQKIIEIFEYTDSINFKLTSLNIIRMTLNEKGKKKFDMKKKKPPFLLRFIGLSFIHSFETPSGFFFLFLWPYSIKSWLFWKLSKQPTMSYKISQPDNEFLCYTVQWKSSN